MNQDAFIRWAKNRGYRLAFADTAMLGTIQETLERRREGGEFDPAFFEENLDIFEYPGERRSRVSRSVLVVAVPAPVHILTFQVRGETVETILPPTYVRYRPLFEQVKSEIRNEVLGEKDSIELLTVPLKSLAVVSGMAVYGRNNITYIPGFGSYHQLAAYALDIPVEAEIHPDALERMLDLCRSCTACLKGCPTGAIAEDRFLLHAEHCYTLHSESLRPFPEGMNPPSPDCLIGCLKCQTVCPANKGRLKRGPAPVSFTAEETTALVAEGEIGGAPLNERIGAKFKTLGVSEGIPLFRRNLRRLLKLRSPAEKR